LEENFEIVIKSVEHGTYGVDDLCSVGLETVHFLGTPKFIAVFTMVSYHSPSGTLK